MEDVQACLDVLDVYVRYGFFSVDALPNVVEALSRAVNIEKFCTSSWQIMKSVLKSDVCAHAVVQIFIFGNLEAVLEITILFLGLFNRLAWSP